MRGTPLLTCLLCALVALVWAPVAAAQSESKSTGGAEFSKEKKAKPRALQVVPGPTATVGPDGLAAAPAEAPVEVHQAIEAANRIVGKPYRYGGGHAKVEDKGYDCSGTVSYALISAGLLESPLPSGPMMSWGEAGEGEWITVYAHGGHAYAVIAGLRLDTSIGSSPRNGDRKLVAQHKKAMEKGPRWRPWKRSSRGFTKRHPVGF